MRNRQRSLHQPAKNSTVENRRLQKPPRRGPPAAPLPPDDIKIVLRPRGGLDLRKVTPAALADTVLQAAQIAQNPQDQLRIRPTPNYVIVSTPSEERAQRYADIKAIQVGGNTFMIAAHVAAPSNTTAGIIFNIPETDTHEEIQSSIFNYNPELPILAVKRLGTSNMAQILFNGNRVPYWVRYRSTTYRCKPYRRKTEACLACWQVGHRQDVCPNQKPSSRCSICGTPNPTEDHTCTPNCIVCEGNHPTGTTDCPQRFQPRRRITYAQVLKDSPSNPSSNSVSQPSNDSGTKRTMNNQASNTQRTASRPNGEPKVSHTVASFHCSALKVTSPPPSQPPPPPPAAIPPEFLQELKAMRQEIQALRAENQALRNEITTLKATNDQPDAQMDTDLPPAQKRKAADPLPNEPEPSLDHRITVVEKSLSNIRKTLHEQKVEFKSTCSNFSASLDALRNELHEGIKRVLETVQPVMGQDHMSFPALNGQP